jgi:hypothetical protein
MTLAAVELLLQDALEGHRSGRVTEARLRYQKVLVLQPAQTEALSLLPVTYSPARSSDTAWGDRATRLSPDNVTGRINHACHLKAVGELRLAERECRIAQTLDPTDIDGHYNRGVVHEALGEVGLAILHYRRALQVSPSSLLTQSNLALCLLATGDFEEGWRLYETRFNYEGFQAWSAYQFAYPRWDGVSDIRGKKLVLWTEQGLGDALQFCRFASLLIDAGAIVTILANTALHRIFCSLRGVSSVCAEPPPDQDFHFPLMSLPYILRIKNQNIPFDSQAYLTAHESDIEDWLKQVKDIVSPKVGLVWRAGAISKIAGRNLDIEWLARLSELPINYVCLQKEVTAQDLDFLKSKDNIKVLEREQRDFADTAAIIDSLDLVITVDTSVAHLAGALGKETWILLTKVCDWRWMVSRRDSPWYSSVRLFRQEIQGDWSSVVSEVKRELAKRFSTFKVEPR